VTDTVERRLEQVRRANFYPEAVARLRARADVEQASLSVGVPFGVVFGEDIRVPGRDSLPQLKGGGPYLSAVSDGFFETVGARIVRGRTFTAADRKGSPAVAIINETMAHTLWPNANPIGQCFYTNGSKDCAEIVGVVANVRRDALKEDEALAFYIPFGQETGIGGTQLIVRPRGDVRAMLSVLRAELMQLDPSITYVSAEVLQDRVEPQIRPWKLGATMFSLMGLLALVVASLGLYSVLAYLVAQRRQEIGIRVALGAQARDIMRLILGNAFGLVLGGVVCGLALAAAGVRFLEPLLFETSPRDPAVFGGVALVLLAVAVMASLVPASRARKVNPMEAMRAE
jgi:predicted permease